MTKVIKESGMRFGEYEESELFHIEKSKILFYIGTGIKTVEFIIKKNENEIWFVEAKESVLNPANKDETEKKQEKFKEFCTDVPKKYHDSLQVYLASILHCYHDISEIGDSLQIVNDFRDYKLKFVFVVRNAKVEWLAGPREILKKQLQDLLKIWDINVIVLNQELARKCNLIQEK